MKTYTTLALALLLGTTAHNAAAQGTQTTLRPFIGLTQTSLKIKFDNLPNSSFRSDAIGLTGGLPLTENLWLEAKALKGTSGDTLGVNRVELDHYLGASLVGRLPIISTGFSLYGSVGAGVTKLSANGNGTQASESDTGLGYGFGLMYSTGALNLRIGYESLYSQDGVEIDGVNVGGSYRF